MKTIFKYAIIATIILMGIAGIRGYKAYNEYQTKTFELRLERAELKHKLDSVMWINPASEEVSNLYEEYCDLTLKINNIK